MSSLPPSESFPAHKVSPVDRSPQTRSTLQSSDAVLQSSHSL
jgi:hypothetical protein